MNEYVALALVFLSGVGFSIQGLFQKILSESGFHDTFITVLFQGIIQAACLGSVLLFDEERYRLNGTNKYLLGDNIFTARMLMLRAVLGFGSLAFAFLAFDTMPLGDASVLVMLGPLVAAVLSALLLGEPFLRSEMMATAFTLIGAILVTKPPIIFQLLPHSPWNPDDEKLQFNTFGIICGLLASLCAGGSFVMLRVLGTTAKVDYKNVCFVQGAVRAVLAPPAVLLSTQRFGFGQYNWMQYMLMISSGVIATGAQICMTLGLQRVKSAVGSTMRMSDIVLSFLLQMLFTRDAVDPLSACGAILVIFGISYGVWLKEAETDITAPKAIDIELYGMTEERPQLYESLPVEEVEAEDL